MNYLNELEAYRAREIEVYEKLDLVSVNTVMNVLEEARLFGRKIFICGNGGSASTASHFVCDFNKLVPKNQEQKYDFECLSDNAPMMMAIANDFGYDEVFRFMLRDKMKTGDILIGISGSGNSKNVVNAFEYAKEIGGTIIAIVGYNGGKIKAMADYSIHVDVNDMQISEDLHLVLDHMMISALSHR